MACPTCRGGNSGTCACSVVDPDGVPLPGVGLALSPFVVPEAVVAAGAGITVDGVASGTSGQRVTYTVSLGGSGTPTLSPGTTDSGLVATFITRTGAGGNDLVVSDGAGSVQVVLPGAIPNAAVQPYQLCTVTFSTPRDVRGAVITPLRVGATLPAPGGEAAWGEDAVAAGLYVDQVTHTGFTVAATTPVAGRTYRFCYVVL